MQRIATRLAALGAAAAALLAVPAHAALTLTSDGIAKGFTLSLFVDQVPASGFCCGPLGVATNNLGQVVIQVYPNGANFVFNDVDNQHFSASLSSAAYSSFSYGAALTNSGGNLFATNNDAGGVVFKLNPDGSSAGALTGANAGGHGIWTNPVTGHLVAATGFSINDIDPVTGTFTPIVSGVNVDGVSVSPDGKTVYGAGGFQVFGWDIATGNLVYSSGGITSFDGTGVITGSSSLAGNIVANANDGTVWLLDPVAKTSLMIASGGSRGDYVGLDMSNGTLFLTQTDSVYRLSCGKDCGFVVGIPEPSTLGLSLFGLAGVAWRVRRNKVVQGHKG